MSTPAKETKPDFDEEFLQTLKEWREKHKIPDDDAVHLLVEMFRIHQKHWDATGDRDIPYSTYAKFVVDTATSLGQGGDKGFFKSQAQTHIAYALELLAELQQPVTLAGVYALLSNQMLLKEELQNLNDLFDAPRRRVLHDHFTNRFLNQPAEQLGGVRETIGNYLQYFLTPEEA